MKLKTLWLAAASILACSAAAGSGPAANPGAVLPRGASIEASGFATIEQAPPSPFPERPPAAENRPRDEDGYYAQLAGISDSEARRRMAEQRASRPEFERLLGRLRAGERGNFTEARMVHRPDWAYVFYFKRDPSRTLARYTRNPHFKAAQARYSQAELRAIAAPWIERLGRHRLLGGHGTDATLGEIGIDLVVSEAEFRSIAEREGWRLPDSIRLRFSEAVAGRPVADPVLGLIRIFPQADRALRATNQALLGGRILLRDGCFYVSGPNRSDRLAYFAREVAVGIDDDGFLALRTRGTEPRVLGRIGEQFSWGGPIGTSESLPMVAELRKRCGHAPLEHVGIPQSARLFEVRPWVIDAIAERRKIGRDEAWRRFRACLERREAGKRGAQPDCDTL
ncbi:MAG TPA: hypothetical protein VF759_09530 [Allosphingosinicella sp.]|jgi:hypothetical protein